MKLTIFDLDNTLLAGDSDYAWGQFLVNKGLVDADEYTRENDRFYEEYKRKTLNIHEYQAFVLKPLMPMPNKLLRAIHDEFLQTVISELRQTKADDLIREHRQQADELMIITATNRFIAGPIGPFLGINTVLATEPEIVDGQMTGKLIGTPCFQEGKITRLQQWLQRQSLTPSELTFYSDSINDLPLMKYVDKAIAVDPDDELRSFAEKAGWPIISLRD